MQEEALIFFDTAFALLIEAGSLPHGPKKARLIQDSLMLNRMGYELSGAGRPAGAHQQTCVADDEGLGRPSRNWAPSARGTDGGSYAARYARDRALFEECAKLNRENRALIASFRKAIATC
jgi:hypothetical protein